MDYNEINTVLDLIKRKKIKEAVEEANKIIANPNLVLAFLPEYAESLRKAELYSQLVDCYEIWVSKKIALSLWDFRHFANALRKIEKYDEALDVCQSVINVSPNFKPILSEYYWTIYYKKIKYWNIDNVSESEIVPFTEEVRDCFKNDKNRQFTPYDTAIIYIAEFYNHKKDYQKCIDWLSELNVEGLNKIGKFKKGNEIIVFIPPKAKYYLYFSNSLINLKKTDEAKELIIKALYEYPFWSKLSENLLILAEQEYQCKGFSLLEKMLIMIGFTKEKIRTEYLRSLTNSEYINSWENGFLDDYTKSFHQIMIAKVLKKLYSEISLKKVGIQRLNIDFNLVSSSEVGSFVFCPAAYCIQKSYQIVQDSESNIELVWDEKKLLLDRIAEFKKSSNLHRVFTQEELDFIGNIPNELIDVLKSTILQENKTNSNPQIFFNLNKTFAGVPDYWLSNNGNFVVSEVFTHYNQYKLNKQNEYLNHKAEVLSQIIELNQLNAQKGYVLYWLWSFEKVQYQNKVSTEYKLKGVHIYEIDLTPENKNFYSNTINEIRILNSTKKMNFNINSISSNKCVNCSVSKYCYHKTGNLSILELPYNEK